MRRDVFFRQVSVQVVSLLICLLLFCVRSGNAADGVSTMLRFPELNIRAGEPVLLKAYFYNEGLDTMKFIFPDSLSLRVQTADGASVLVTAVETGSSPDAVLGHGEFLTKEYNVVLPKTYYGVMDISMADSPDTEVLINILNGEGIDEAILAGPPAETANEDYPSLDSLFSLYQPYVVNFAVYEPMYFLVGADPSESKFQISLKYRPINPAGSLSQQYPWLSGLHFAYTQTSFWDLASDSAPFEDTSYKPEVFYLTRNWPDRPFWLKGLFFQGGLQHESNGRDGESSRSTNTVYFKPIFIFYNADSELGLQISPKLLAYFDNSRKNNPDLADYRGNVEFEIKLGKASGLVSTTYLRFANRGTSIQTDLSYPVSKLLKNNFDLFLNIQYSYSLAESLINYKERNQSLRIGFSIVR
ncbi:MAG: phospholipase A [Deltaproteobacteria bacterium]|nr:phospholipase A [Deltaproteobacteria bacterium]